MLGMSVNLCFHNRLGDPDLTVVNKSFNNVHETQLIYSSRFKTSIASVEYHWLIQLGHWSGRHGYCQPFSEWLNTGGRFLYWGLL